jgi:hypothetical protein
MSHDEQGAHLARVSDRISDAILAFQTVCGPDEQWYMDDLRLHVIREVGAVAPASPDRVLRQLRAKRLLNYRVVSRRRSLYEWMPIPKPGQQELFA